jgi:hypothetical protein
MNTRAINRKNRKAGPATQNERDKNLLIQNRVIANKSLFLKLHVFPLLTADGFLLYTKSAVKCTPGLHFPIFVLQNQLLFQ